MTVLNKYHHGGRVPPGAVNIMRGTPFGNPFAVTAERPRDEAVHLFRLHLWERLKSEPEFAAQVRKLHGRDLCCCCAPLACHGDVLEKAAAWLVAQPS